MGSLAGLLLVAGLSPGCSKSSPPDVRDAAPTSVPRPQGLDHPANDPRVASLARGALACPWTDKGLVETCPALIAWKKAVEQDTSADPTLVAMLDDSRDAVRWLSGVGLAEGSRPLHRDGERAKVLVDATRREKHERVGRELGFAVGALDLTATKLEREVRELVTSHPLPLVRLAIVSRTLQTNPSMFELVFQLARTEKDPQVRRSAIGALRLAPAAHREQVGALWVELASDADGEIADAAVTKCAVSEEICRARWDDLLTKMEARATAFPEFMPFALGDLHEQPRATAQQKARAERLAVAVLEATSNTDIARSKALAALARMDPKRARALAAKYVDAPSVVLLPLVARDVLDGDAGAGHARDGG